MAQERVPLLSAEIDGDRNLDAGLTESGPPTSWAVRRKLNAQSGVRLDGSYEVISLENSFDAERAGHQNDHGDTDRGSGDDDANSRDDGTLTGADRGRDAGAEDGRCAAAR
eukprot:5320520-Pleurochrysis_carterae.AAC.1